MMMPNALPRFSRGTASAMMAAPLAPTAADAAPCTKRSTSNAPIELVRPVRIEVAAKASMPSLKTATLSAASPRRPAGRSSATDAARNTVSTRESAVAPAPRSVPSAGSATATPEIMKGGANCDAAIAGTRNGWCARALIRARAFYHFAERRRYIGALLRHAGAGPEGDVQELGFDALVACGDELLLRP